MRWNHYTGIGSRGAPQEAVDKMVEIGAVLGRRGLILRSGGAEGSDLAFQIGADSVGGPMELYHPWVRFGPTAKTATLWSGPSKEALDIAASVHQRWEHSSQGAQKLLARNVHQLMGYAIDAPSMFVMYCHYRNSPGTAFALRLASKFMVPAINIQGKTVREAVMEAKRLYEAYQRRAKCEVVNQANISRDPHGFSGGLYVGRGTKYGNPFRGGMTAQDRSKAIREHGLNLIMTLNQQDWSSGGNRGWTDLVLLRGRTLICHCSPKRCHADTLAEAVRLHDIAKGNRPFVIEGIRKFIGSEK